MSKFRIRVPIEGYATYEVEADNAEDAEHAVYIGCIDSTDLEWDVDYSTHLWETDRL